MVLEFEGLMATGMFTTVDRIPPGSNIVRTRWLHKWKAGSQGLIARVKSRSVARGFSQVLEGNYCDTFSLAASAVFIKLATLSAVKNGLDLNFDTEQVFIQA